MGRAALLAGLGLLMALPGCDTYGGLDRERLGACIASAGIVGTYDVGFDLSNDRAAILVDEGPNVSRAQADAANACIAQAVASPPAPAPRPAAAVAVPPAPVGTPVAVAPVAVAPVAAAPVVVAPVPVAPVAVAPVVVAPVAVAPGAVAPAPRACHLEMVGGAGYACVE